MRLVAVSFRSKDVAANIELAEAMRRHASESSCVFAGILAGTRVFSNRPVSGLPQCGYFDLDVEVLFVNPPETKAADRDKFTQSEGIALPSATGLRGSIAEDGRWAVIEERPDELHVGRGLWIRRVLPFLAALQGKIILHASAVADATAVYAFIGASGAGKTTLSSSFPDSAGLRKVADDLLPCRIRHGAVEVPIDQKQMSLPLRATYFLTKEDKLDRVCYTRLGSVDSLKRLLTHGFGEVTLKKVWAAQFIFYESLARTVPGYDLIVPDVLSRLPVNALEVQALLAEQALQAASLRAGV